LRAETSACSWITLIHQTQQPRFHRRLVHPGPVKSNGKTLGFDVMKGYQSTAEINNEYYSCTLYEDKNIVFNLGSVLVALFCRRGLIKKGGKVASGKEV
jgi:hypothetical protein